jgi:predicted lactoylglutathione lyase
MIEAAGANGGTADINPPEDHGFMFQRSFEDPDGHVWEPMWMDPAVANGEAHVSEAEASA